MDARNIEIQGVLHTSLVAPPDEVDSVWYGSTNLLWAPGANFWMGIELQYGQREDIDGSQGSDYRLQLQLRYTFSERLL